MPLIISPRQLTQRAQFYQQLSQLTSAGIPILTALDMLARNPPAYSYRAPTQKLLALLKDGSPVAEGMRQLGSWMPQFDIALVSAGEHSGRLDAVFKLLANSYEERAALLRQIISDLAYPVFLIHFSVVVFLFVDWMKSSMSLAMFGLKILLYLAPFYILLGLIIYAMQGKRGQHWRAFFERVIRPIPIAGSAIHALALARLTAALEALLNAGVTIIEAWQMAAAACGSPAIKQTVDNWKAQVVGGERLSEVINAAPSQFPEVFRNLYHSGEVSGGLDDTLLRLNAYYREEATRKLRLLSKVGPKVVYFGVAIYIAFRVVMFYKGYFSELNNVMN